MRTLILALALLAGCAALHIRILDNRKPGAMAQDFGEPAWFRLSEPFAVCVVNPLAVPVSVDTLTEEGVMQSMVTLAIPPRGERFGSHSRRLRQTSDRAAAVA